MLFRNNSTKEVTEVPVTVSVKTFAKLILMVVATVILLLAVKRASAALLLIFTAVFLALALNAPVNWVAQHLPGKKRGSRSLATSVSFLLVVLFIGAFSASIVPALVKQTQNFVSNAPSLISDFKDPKSGVGQVVQRYGLENQINDLSKDVNNRLKGAGGKAFNGVQKFGSSLVSLLTVLVLTFMMLVEGPAIMRFFRELIPRKRRDLADRLSKDMYRVVKGYVNGQVTLAALAAVIIFPALIILDISYPIALFVIVFICALIPMIGNTIGAGIVTLVALTQSPSAALFVLAYYIIYQQIENIFIQPRIQANSTNMSPLLVFASVVIGISFGGILGGLVAIPVAGCIRISVLEYLRSRNLIDAPTVTEKIKEASAI
jgi:predicted PurR-regulated permease PerM